MRAILEFLSGIVSALVLLAGILAIEVVTADRPVRPRPADAGPVRMQAPPQAEGAHDVTRLRAPMPPGAYTAAYLEPAEGALPGAELRELRDSAGSRPYRMILPRRAWSGEALPAVVLLHDAGRTGVSMLDIWGALAEPAGLILIAPDARGSVWRSSTDGPEAMAALLDAVEREVRLDRSRIFLFGHGDGAGHALRLANLAPAMWRAVAVHGGALPPQQVFPREGAPPVAILIGTRDPLYPLEAVHRSADALVGAGHAVTVMEIRDHTNWLYDIGPWVAQQAWGFFRSR